MIVSVEIKDNFGKELDKVAEDTERSRSQVIRLAIKQFLDQNATKPKN